MFCNSFSSHQQNSSKKWSWLACYYWATTTVTCKRNIVHALDQALLKRASNVRERLSSSSASDFPTSFEDLYFPSSYPQYGDNARMRGFCNWILPNRIMVGQYPGQTPEPSGPTAGDVQTHLESMIRDANVNLFCSLQSEIPPQTDFNAWEAVNGQVYLEDNYWRRKFPNAFTHYAPVVQSLEPSCQFWHAPIEDLSVPNSRSLQELLMNILGFLEENDQNCVYIHCWGGRGRAGLVSACLMSLLFPEVSSDAQVVLDLVQGGYDSRAGADQMPSALSKSPQTETQRAFVRSFVKERQRNWSTNENRSPH